MEPIPFNVPYLAGNEKRYMDEVFSNLHFAGNGPFTKRVQDLLEEMISAPRVLLTHSCTAALEMAALLHDLGPGDEVIIPSYTFVTTASSMMRTGAKVVFCEIDPETMLIDVDDAALRITDRTKAIVPVHYAGFTTPILELEEICKPKGIAIIEDAAQALGTLFDGLPSSRNSPLTTISFHETKNIHSGLGGCLIINNPEFIGRAEMIWERGTNRSEFFKGLVDKYTWKELGSSFYPTEFQAAFLLAQLENMDANLTIRRALWNAYEEAFIVHENRGLLRILRPPKNCNDNAHMFAILLPTSEIADKVRIHLNDNGVNATIHYVPLHASAMGERMGMKPADLPITLDASSRLVRLPLHHELKIEDIQFIASLLFFFTDL